MELLGTTDARTDCDCCGRNDLKHTVAIDTGGDVVYYGSKCASNALGQTWAETRAALKSTRAENVRAVREYDRTHPLTLRRRLWLDALDEVNDGFTRAGRNRISFESRKLFMKRLADWQGIINAEIKIKFPYR